MVLRFSFGVNCNCTWRSYLTVLPPENSVGHQPDNLGRVATWPQPPPCNLQWPPPMLHHPPPKLGVCPHQISWNRTEWIRCEKNSLSTSKGLGAPRGALYVYQAATISRQTDRQANLEQLVWTHCIGAGLRENRKKWVRSLVAHHHVKSSCRANKSVIYSCLTSESMHHAGEIDSSWMCDYKNAVRYLSRQSHSGMVRMSTQVILLYLEIPFPRLISVDRVRWAG